MRIQPNLSRLRIVAIVCWLLSGWWLVHIGRIETIVHTSIFLVAAILASSIFLAIGIAFWQLGTDRQAGLFLDAKGIMLNLGHYAAFVAWNNLESMGVSQHRSSLLALGSSRQLGIRLCDTDLFLQTYEERLPASHGPLGATLRLLDRLLRPWNHHRALISPEEQLRRNRERIGYDILIPEALLGKRAEEFVELASQYRRTPQRSYLLRLHMLDAA